MSHCQIFPILTIIGFLPFVSVYQPLDFPPLYEDLQGYPPPPELYRPMQIKVQQLRSGGPPGAYPRAKEALCLPTMSHNDVLTDNIISEIKSGIRHIFQTDNEWTFPIQGSGLTGCQAILENLIESGDKVLTLENGYFGPVMSKIAERSGRLITKGARVHRFEKTVGQSFNIQEIATLLNVIRPNIVTVVQGETSTTVYQDLEGWGELCKKYGALLVVDVIGIVGFQPLFMDKYKIDAVFAGTQKGIGSVVGMAAVSLSQRAVKKIQSRRQPPAAIQTDLTLLHTLWNTDNPNRLRYMSLSLPLLYSLREGLATVVEEGLENTYKRHKYITEQLYQGLESLGLKHFVEDSKTRLIGTTAVYKPEGKDVKRIADFMNSKYGIEISYGFGPVKGDILRFGLIGSGANKKNLENLLDALKDALSTTETNADIE